jgi:hypothetical protein
LRSRFMPTARRSTSSSAPARFRGTGSTTGRAPLPRSPAPSTSRRGTGSLTGKGRRGATRIRRPSSPRRSRPSNVSCRAT